MASLDNLLDAVEELDSTHLIVLVNQKNKDDEIPVTTSFQIESYSDVLHITQAFMDWLYEDAGCSIFKVLGDIEELEKKSKDGDEQDEE